MGECKLAQTHRKGTLVYAANLVGVALIMLVGISLGMLLLGDFLARALFQPEVVSGLRNAPEWFRYTYASFTGLAVFLPPYFFLKSTGEPLGLKLHFGKGRLPLIILIPLFLGLVTLVNSIASMVRNFITMVFSLPGAEPAKLPATGIGLVLYFVAVCVLPAILEELFFRGALQGLLRRWGSRFAIVTTSVLFTLLHTDIWQLPTVFVLSLALGYAAEVTGTVRSSIILHFINNLSAFILVLAQQKLTGEAAFAFVFWVMVLFVALLAGAIWAVRYFKMGHKLLVPADWPTPKGKPKRVQRLLFAPAFIAGVLALCAYTILRIASFVGA